MRIFILLCSCLPVEGEDDWGDSESVVTRVEAVAVNSDDSDTTSFANNSSIRTGNRRRSRSVGNRRPRRRRVRSLEENHVEGEDDSSDDNNSVRIIRSGNSLLRLQRQNGVAGLEVTNTTAEAIFVQNDTHSDDSDEDDEIFVIRRPQYSSNIYPYTEV